MSEQKLRVPSILSKVMLAAFAMCVCQIIVAPIYVSLSRNHLALLPWLCVACLLSVAFCVTIGFALMWIEETLERRVRKKFVSLIAAAIGMAAFGLWGSSVIPAVFNSLVVPLGLGELVGLDYWAVVLNCAVIGALSFAVASVLFRKVSGSRAAIAWLSVAMVVLSGAGIYFLAQMYGFLYQ